MIKISIKGKEYTIEEARELYNELKVLFGDTLPWTEPINVPWVQPYPYVDHTIKYTTVTDTPGNKWFYDGIKE